VPYGCPEEPPALGAPVLKGVHPQIPEDAFLILWSGGTWEWFDPLCVLEAFREVVAAEPRARLYFMGLELPDRGVPPQRVARELVERARELGLAGESVVFDTWVPYAERGRYLAEADVAVVAARDLAESRLAFRSRILDHFWTGLPTVATRGDVLSELAEREGAAITVAPGDVPGLRDALLLLCRDPELRGRMAARSAALADGFRWSKAIRPLEALVAEPWRWWGARARRPSQAPLTEDAQLLLARTRGRRDASAASAFRLRAAAVARGIWWRTPESVRTRARPFVRRAQGQRSA
jgi:glycosyltransferase involved in cell wall biosynthesis